VCEQLAQGCYVKAQGRKSNPRANTLIKLAVNGEVNSGTSADPSQTRNEFL